MSERSADIKELRRGLVRTMSPASAKMLRSTVLDSDGPIRYFANPLCELTASCSLAKVAFGEHRGLDSLFMLAVTAENPVQLANSTGAIAAATNINRLWTTYNNSPHDLSYIGKRTDQSVKTFMGSLEGKPSGSYMGENLTDEIRNRAKGLGPAQTNEIFSDLTKRFFLLNPDEGFMAAAVEGFFLIALDNGGKQPQTDRLRSNLATAFLSRAYPIFLATDTDFEKHPEHFDLLFGRKASFWQEFRYDLFPNLERTCRQIIDERVAAGPPRIDTNLIRAVDNLFRVAAPRIKAEEERKRIEIQAKIRTEQESLKKAREARDRALNPEKYAWLDAKAGFETKWQAFVTGYEKNNGSLNSPLTHSEFVDLFTQGIDLLHEAIFAGKNDTEIRAGMETILPKFWPHKELQYVMEDFLHEYEYDTNGNPIKVIVPGEKVLAQIVFLPKELRPPKLGSAIKLNEAQQSARNRIVRSLAKAAHPDKSYVYSDPKDAASVDNFLRTANQYKNYER